MKVKLNYIDQSNDTNNISVVVFQKPINPEKDMDIVAWKVIKKCGRGSCHPFEYDHNVQASILDHYGNCTVRLNVESGDLLEVVLDQSGIVAVLRPGQSTVCSEIQVKNSLKADGVAGKCYRNGKLVAQTKNIPAGELGRFELEPVIYVGVVSTIEEGEIIPPAIVSQEWFECSLQGLRSADIVMGGGGSGEYTFALENVVYY